MQLALRPYATAGIALVGASVIAISPVAPPPLPVQVASPAVQLAAAVNPIDPWLAVFNNSAVNFAGLANEVLSAPAPVLQQFIANQIRYLGALPEFELILGNVLNNLQNVVNAPLAVDTSTLDPAHVGIWGVLPTLLPAELQPVLNFTTTYLSGVLLGLVGPVVAPVLALGASIHAVIGALTAANPDPIAALNELINIPAKMADAFLNGGQTLDLTPVLSVLGLNLTLVPDSTTKVGLTFGGLLSPGGSIFNAINIEVFGDGPDPQLTIPGTGPGAIGSLIGLSQAIAKALGWSGAGNPLAPPLPPLTPPTEPEQERALVGPGDLPGPDLKDARVLAAPADKVVEPAPVTKDVIVTEEVKDTAADNVAVDNAAEDDTSGATDPDITEKPVAESPTSTPKLTQQTKPTPRELRAERNALGKRLKDAVKSAGDDAKTAVSSVGKDLKKRAEKKAESKTESAGSASDSAD